MFQRLACSLGRRSRNGSSDDFSTFPIRQLFVLGKCGTFVLRTMRNKRYGSRKMRRKPHLYSDLDC
jgi:hypothetical protein